MVRHVYLPNCIVGYYYDFLLLIKKCHTSYAECSSLYWKEFPLISCSHTTNDITVQPGIFFL